MRALAASLLLLASTTVFAAEPPQTWVLVGREGMQRKLLRANEALSEAIGRLQKKNPEAAASLKAARAELDSVREQLAAAPESRAAEEGQRMVGGMMVGTMGTIDREMRADRDERREHERRENDREREDRERLERDRRPPPPPPPPAAPVQPVVYPMNDAALAGLMAAITAESFPRDRLRVLEEAAPSNWFVVAQVQRLLQYFDFPRDRLAAARVLKPRILDRENYFQLYGSFDFPNDKAELKKILSQ
jgi:hypothetical protein